VSDLYSKEDSKAKSKPELLSPVLKIAEVRLREPQIVYEEGKAVIYF
jgi:hypothetical protein